MEGVPSPPFSSQAVAAVRRLSPSGDGDPFELRLLLILVLWLEVGAFATWSVLVALASSPHLHHGQLQLPLPSVESILRLHAFRISIVDGGERTTSSFSELTPDSLARARAAVATVSSILPSPVSNRRAQELCSERHVT